MLLGPKSKKKTFFRHLFVATVSSFLVYLVWRVNSTWSPDMRLWKSFGGGTFMLLWFTIFIGPAAKLWSPLTYLVSWRRETGIWFAIVGLVHGYLILDGWVRWSAWGFLGYQYVPELEMYLRAEPGFGLANLMGLLALIFTLALFATSSDKAVNYLGVSSWKWLHSFAYVIFYLAALHVVYYSFIHFSPSPERVLRGLPTNYPENPLRFYYLGALLSVFSFQVMAFIKTVRQQRKSLAPTPKSTKEVKTKIKAIKKIAKETFEVSLVRPKDFEFTAGQHIQLALLKLKYADPKGKSRVLSICSSPYDKDTLCVAFRNTGSGYKKTLLELPVGSSLSFEGPLGHFTLPKNDGKKNIFIAGGIGITPFMSMIQSALSGDNPPSITLLYANRDEESCAYLNELKQLSGSSKDFSFYPIVGRIIPDEIQKHVRDIDNISWWIVGPPGMVTEVKHMLAGVGVSDNNIRIEEFTGY